MPWWILAIAIVVMIVIIYLMSRYISPGKENFVEMIKKGKIEEVKKKAKDSMEVYEAYQEAYAPHKG
jgi:predicted Holliday junction resolvase-like endonuclease